MWVKRMQPLLLVNLSMTSVDTFFFVENEIWLWLSFRRQTQQKKTQQFYIHKLETIVRLDPIEMQNILFLTEQ